jgi:hypothetical protein
MVRAPGGKRLQIWVREKRIPFSGYDGTINSLQGGVSPFITPREEATMEVYLSVEGLM